MPKRISTVVKERGTVIRNMRKRVKSKSNLAKLTMLLIIKNRQVSYVSELALELKRNRHTIGIWIKKYEDCGIEELLKRKNEANAKRRITPEIEKAIARKFRTERNIYNNNKISFSHVQMQKYINKRFKTKIKYITLYNVSRKIKERIRSI